MFRVQRRKQKTNKLKLSEKCHPCSMFQITNVITASRQHLIISSLTAKAMIGQNLSLQQSGAPVSSAWATRQEASETGEAQWFQQRSNVNIDMYLYLFQPSFHPDRPDQPVWCLESGAALPILVLCVINNRQKVSINYQPLNAKKLENFTSKCNGNILHSTRKLYLVYL